jgi:hypothetical protein
MLRRWQCALVGTLAALSFHAAEAASSPIRLTTAFSLNGRDPNLSVEVENRSRQAICVGAHSFDPLLADVHLQRPNGSNIRRIATATPVRDWYHGIDAAQSYYFLFPGRTETFYVSLRAFDLGASSANFEFQIAYYDCNELLALQKPGKQENQPTMRIVGVKGIIRQRGH